MEKENYTINVNEQLFDRAANCYIQEKYVKIMSLDEYLIGYIAMENNRILKNLLNY